MEPFFDTDTDVSEEEMDYRHEEPPRNLPLHQFIRYLAAGPHLVNGGPSRSNDDLIQNLQRLGTLTDNAVATAMRICARELFVPEAHKQEALFDSPIRVDALGVNISAPHMHATMIEALSISPGHSVLDIGSGCGLVTAACAFLAGTSGSVLGIEIKKECVHMGRSSEALLRTTNTEYASSAGPCQFECLNAFLLGGTDHIGRYDRIHVGANCPPERLQLLLPLLKPQAGLMVVPVSPSDLRLITSQNNGKYSQKVISQVRFSELEVPDDAEIVLARMRSERGSKMKECIEASTYESDVHVIIESCKWKVDRNDDFTKFMSSSPISVTNGLPPSPTSTASHHPAPSTPSNGVNDGFNDGSACDEVLTYNMLLRALGRPDCTVVCPETGWSTPAHSAVLRQRCDVLKARYNSGMADSDLSIVTIPEHFSPSSVKVFCSYLYTDRLDFLVMDTHRDDGKEEEDESDREDTLLVEVLHVAQYFGCHRCIQLCEHALARSFKASVRGLNNESTECASSLLALARSQGLPHLKALSLDFIVNHYESVAQTDSYKALSAEEVRLVAAEACRQLTRAMDILKEVHKYNHHAKSAS